MSAPGSHLRLLSPSVSSALREIDFSAAGPGVPVIPVEMGPTATGGDTGVERATLAAVFAALDERERGVPR